MNDLYCTNRDCSQRLYCATAQNLTRNKRMIYGVGDCFAGCQDYKPLRKIDDRKAQFVGLSAV